MKRNKQMLLLERLHHCQNDVISFFSIPQSQFTLHLISAKRDHVNGTLEANSTSTKTIPREIFVFTVSGFNCSMKQQQLEHVSLKRKIICLYIEKMYPQTQSY